MGVTFSKITARSLTVVPREVRERLGLKPGDTLRYTITGEGVVIDKASDAEREDPFATFQEWASEADERAYDAFSEVVPHPERFK